MARKSIHKIPKEFLDKEYVGNGLSTTAIAKLCGCSTNTVNISIRQHGLTIRSNGEHKIKSIVGKQFGRWKVLEQAESQNEKSRWVAECVCGYITTMYYPILKKGTHCRKCSGNERTSKEPITNNYWNRVKKAAREREYVFEITKEYAYNLFLKQNAKCALSGIDIFFVRKVSLESDTTASLDRIDNTKGYVVGNVQWVHKDVNRMKHSFQQSHFLDFCHKISNSSCTKRNMMNQICVIMQGASGSGKSTLAKQIASVIDAEIFSTDDFHVDSDGVYRFKPEQLGLFHKKNQERAIAAMQAGKNVIIDNTNIKKFEAKNYVQAALQVGASIRFVRANGNFKNVHGVPDDKVQMMREKLEDLSVEGCLASVAPWDRK